MKKQLIFLAVISLFCSIHLQQIHAQSVGSSNLSFWDNVSYGGAFGLGFGNGYFDATLAPTAIYNFNPTHCHSQNVIHVFTCVKIQSQKNQG